MFRINSTSCVVAFSLLILLSVTGAVASELPMIQGVFGLSPVLDSMAIAMWVPLVDGEAVSGVSWYNNDGSVVFPEFLAVAGEYGHPEFLASAMPVGSNIVGVTSGWSSWQFSQPLASGSSGLYLIIQLPASADFISEGEGGGAGLGYINGSDANNCWVTGDGCHWDSLEASYQMAIVPEMSVDKSGSVLVLEKPDGINFEIEKQVEAVVPLQPCLSAVPNPFNPSTAISFSLPQASKVQLNVYDLRGRLIRNLLQEYRDAGEISVTWNGRDQAGLKVSSGTYFVRMISDDLHTSTKITLVQ